MADVQKPVAVPETTPIATETAAETKPVETTPAAETPATEAKAVETPAETTETAAATEDKPAEAADKPVEEAKKEEVKPIEAGALEHKGTPASFPKNVFYSKNHFWFGSDSLSTEKLSTYLKHEKATDIAHHVTSWASETGKGLLFFSKESDKSTPTGAIQLSEASEPTVDGTHKFSFTSKGHKHTFKAPTAADRDNWVAQLKLKIAEAKELAPTVTESETYKKTLEGLKPTPAVKKEEKPVAVAEPVKEEVKEEPAKEETREEEKKEEIKEEKKEPKPRSSSKKRASIFGSFLGKKEEAKKETPAEDKPVEDKPVETTGVTTTAIPAESTPATEPVKAVEDKPAESPVEETKKEEPVKPTPSKRTSIFGTFSGFGKKKAEPEAAPATPAKETPAAEAEPVAESAPVIPAVETSEPLSAEVASPATVPTETTEVTPATNGETKKEVKSEKRKSSMPFAFGKKDKSAPTSDEEGEKTKTPLFSKLRQTVKGKGKATEKPVEKPAEDKPAETEATAVKPVEETKTDEVTPEKKEEAAPAIVPAVEDTPAEKPAAVAPAPVTAAA